MKYRTWKASLDEWLEQCGHEVGIVFTDVVGSTLLLNQQKTKNYGVILRAHASRALGLAEQFDGRIVVNVGDQILAACRTAANAFRFAEALFHDPGDAQLRVRAGVHFGTVRAHETGLVGRDVHIAARVMAHGHESELWVSDAAKRALERESQALAAAITWIANEECELKGISDTHRLWRAA
jgi:class 3 adenylate cyclase